MQHLEICQKLPFYPFSKSPSIQLGRKEGQFFFASIFEKIYGEIPFHILRNFASIIFLSIVTLSVFSARANSAEIFFVAHNGLNIVIEGEIVEGDEEKFLQLAQSARGGLQKVFLYSAGGNLHTAMGIGRAIRKLALPTYSAQRQFCLAKDRNNCICASACFFIHAGGIERYGSNLLVHSPYFDPSQFAQLSFSDARRAYNSMLVESRSYLTGC